MSSSSRTTSKRREGVLRVTAANPAVAITVLGPDLATVGRGVGELELKLAPGIYGARFHAGASIREQTAILGPGEHVEIHEPGIAFATTAPLAGTRDDFENHTRAARDLSRQTDCSIGTGAGLFVFVRDVTERTRTIPTRGLTLRGPADEVLVDFGEHAHASRGSGARWAGCSVELDPGAYKLRSSGGDGGAVEQTVVVAPDWQTQVFLGRRAAPRSGRGRRVDLAGASVLMARDGFDPDRSDLHAAELARLGLRDRTAAVPEEALQNMLYDKFENPMLGLYGAHLIVRGRNEPDLELLDTVVHNLRRLIGGHPDVEALELYLDRAPDGLEFAAPPMLYSSWQIVVGHTVDRPGLVPRESFCAAISDRLLVGSPWLQWRPSRRRRVENASDWQAGDGLADALTQVADALPDPRTRTEAELAQVGPVEDIGSVARDVVRLAEKVSAKASRDEVSASSLVDDDAVVRALGVPRSVAEDAVGLVYKRLIR